MRRALQVNGVSLRALSRWLGLALCAALSLSACGGGDAPTRPSGSLPPSGNQAPTISGAPPTSTLVGRQYSFVPTASDANGDVLTFTITGRPAWATFDAASGRLQGTPAQADIGSSSSVSISVSDGSATATLTTFNLQVVATATGSATLTWSPPTFNSDGSALTNLASYRVYFGMTAGSYPNSIAVANPGLASFVVDQLTPATWHFVVTAVNSNGAESVFSNAATKIVN
jgi:hypothetical protein